ncbi:MAG TPA: MFS transporter [Blastocatellia bacterium]|nr:MFS transporter [Blastocatellia bacterium]
MANRRSPLVIIFITIFIDLVGFGIVIPVLPLYAEHFHATPTVVGLLLAVYSAMQFIFAPVLGRLSDRVGRRPVLLVSIIGSSLGFLIMGLAGSLWLLFLARIVDGITGGNISTAQAYIADVTPQEKRSSGMGLIGAAFGLGFIFGPAIGGLLSQVSLGAPFLFASALAACNAVALFFLLPESLAHEHRTPAGQRASIIQVFQKQGSWQLGAVIGTYFFATVAFAMLTAVFPLFTEHRFGYDARHNGYIFAYLGVLGALIQGGAIGRLSGIFGDKTLAAAGIGILAVSMFVLPSSVTLAVLLLATSGIATGNSLATPTLNALASKSVGAKWQGRILGMMQSSASLARIIGPVLGGSLLGRDNPAEYGRMPFWTGAAIMLVAFLLALSTHAAPGAKPVSDEERVKEERVTSD